MRLACFASSAAPRRTSAARFFSSAVGPVPENTPRAEWYGPQTVSAPEDVVDLDHRLEPVARLLPDRRVGADGVVVLGQDGDRRALEPLLVEFGADRLVVGGRAAEDGQLDAVEPGGLQLAQEREVFARDAAGPQQQVHPDFHGESPLMVVLAALSSDARLATAMGDTEVKTA